MSQQGPFYNPQPPHNVPPPYNQYPNNNPPYPYNNPPYPNNNPHNPYYNPPYPNNNTQSQAAPPPAGPLPLGKAIKQLFGQYTRVFTSPGRATFAQELPKAAWNIVWVQLIGLALLSFIPTFVFFDFIIPALTALLFHDRTDAILDGILGLLAIFGTFGPFFYIPLAFFAQLTIQYGAARLLGGTGKFVQHAYARTLILIPAQLLPWLLLLIPGLGELLYVALAFYTIVLSILMIMAVHRIGGFKAFLAYFSPYIVGAVAATSIYFLVIYMAVLNT